MSKKEETKVVRHTLSDEVAEKVTGGTGMMIDKNEWLKLIGLTPAPVKPDGAEAGKIR